MNYMFPILHTRNFGVESTKENIKENRENIEENKENKDNKKNLYDGNVVQENLYDDNLVQKNLYDDNVKQKNIYENITKTPNFESAMSYEKTINNETNNLSGLSTEELLRLMKEYKN